MTKNPDIPFLRIQLSFFSEEHSGCHLIHDNSGELKYFPYKDYDIKGVATVPYSPNMNAFAERFVRSVRQECLDYFIIFSEKQLRRIFSEYVNYYNNYRPHQGVGCIPNPPPDIPKDGEIKAKPVLFGLHHHYYRKTA
jgi:putative transposase